MEPGVYAFFGLIQGITEFLPVSSSGHLVLLEHWLGLNPPGIVLEVVVHVATLFSVIIVYRRDVARIITGENWRYLWLLILGTLVTVAIVLPLKDQLSELTESPLAVRIIGMMLLFTAAWLALADLKLQRGSGNKPVGWGASALIGLAQAIAALPGISRSGATIGAAVQLQVSREESARFSFLLSVPVILGAGIITAVDIPSAIKDAAISLPGLAMAFIFALVSGIVAIHVVLHMLRNARLRCFAWYCTALGALALIVG